MSALAGCGKGTAQQDTSGPAAEGRSSVQETSPETPADTQQTPPETPADAQQTPSEPPADAQETPADAPETPSEPEETPPEPSTEKNLLSAAFLKVGKADAIVVRSGDTTMVIDCGEDDDGQKVLDYLEGQGVSQVDVLLITHFDKDHVGGADTVVKGIEVDRVLQPDYEGVVDAYTDFEEALAEEGIAPENVVETLYFDLGEASVTVEPPASYDIPDESKEYDNNFSLITTVEYGDGRFVFAGDIEKKRIREWLAQGSVPTCDVLKVPHHGVYNGALEELFETLSPKYAVICDSSKNPADSRTLELLSKCGADCLETKDGDVTILCDGKTVWTD